MHVCMNACFTGKSFLQLVQQSLRNKKKCILYVRMHEIHIASIAAELTAAFNFPGVKWFPLTEYSLVTNLPINGVG